MALLLAPEGKDIVHSVEIKGLQKIEVVQLYKERKKG